MLAGNLRTFAPMFCTLTGILASLAALVQLLYLLLFSRNKSQRFSATPKPSVSILICARNESENLRLRLPQILKQEYKNFEVLVIDDGSEDDTKAVIAALQNSFPNLRYRRIAEDEKSFPGKKGALQIGVEEAAHDLLLFTDADCVPASPFWIEKMVAAFSEEKEIVLGYGPYEAAPGALNAFVRAETLLSFVGVKAFHRFGIHYTAVGRNLAVRKATFKRATRHPLWTQTLSGDDDMLVRICATSQNVAVVDDLLSFMYSPAKENWAAYRAQKQRHLSTGKYYRMPVKILLFLLNGSHVASGLFLLPVLFCVGMYACPWCLAGLALLLLRALLFAAVLRKEARVHREKLPLRSLVFFDVAYAVYPLFFAPYIFWKNKQEWN